MNKKLTKEELENNLAQFCGGDSYYKFTPFAKMVCTEGVAYLIENGHGWLMDILASVQQLPSIKGQAMQVLIFDKSQMTVRIEDGNKNVLYTQKIDYTDSQLDEIIVWATFEEHNKRYIVLLPSEY